MAALRAARGLRLPRRWTPLQVALALSLALHAALLTLRFVDPEGFERFFADTPLEVVLVNARLSAIGLLPAHPPPAPPSGRAPAAPIARRRVHLGGAAAEAPVFRFAALAPDQALSGPAVVESETTTVLLRPGDEARMDARGWLDIAVPAAG